MLSEPPLLSEYPRPRPSPAMNLAVAVVGLLQLGLALATSNRVAAGADAVSAQIGFVIGATAVWPLIVIGVFALGRRFRNPRTRAVILLSVWSFTCCSHALILLKPVSAAPNRAEGVEVPAAEDAADTTTAGSVASVDAAPTEAPVSGEPAAKWAPPFDFSPGSHMRLVEQIEHAQESAYHEVVRAYAEACRARPTDARLALEWVEFVAHFADAEDSAIESVSGDYEAAESNLVKRFPTVPGTILFQLERLYGAEFTAKAESCTDQLRLWSDDEVARFALLRAQRAPDSDSAAKLRFAEQSFRKKPSAEAGVLYAGALQEAHRKGEAGDILRHDVFADVAPWLRKEQIELLLAIGDVAGAMSRLEELQGTAPGLVHTAAMAEKLAAAGEIDAARAVWAKVPVNKWSSASLAKQRFEFELVHGDGAQAESAYRAWRGHGFSVDPFLRDRAALWLKAPRAAWRAEDLGGALLLLVLLGVMALLPLLALLPVHYWSLLRAQRHRVADWNLTPWGLRAAWLVTGATLVGMTLSIWVYQPQILAEGFSNSIAPHPTEPTGGKILLGQTILWTITGMLALVLLWRARAWRLLGAGQWSAWKAVGIGTGAAWGLRTALAVYLAVIGGLETAVTQASPVTSKLMLATLESWGPVGLIVATGCFVPVMEEVLFRGVLLGALARHIPFWAANLLQALAFAAVHEELSLAPFFIAFALVNGLLVQRSRGLLAAIALHMLNNLVVCVGLIVLNR